MKTIEADKIKNLRVGESHNYGQVLRASGIFYFKQSATFKTTISFLNYWVLKRDVKVAIVASVRELSGKLVRRESLVFDPGMVINYCPSDLGDFEGSIEIEAFGNTNLFIPYAGIMAMYESERGISMVHSYSRVYCPHEVEEGNMHSEGSEVCLPMKDTDTVDSYTIFHNGFLACSPQVMSISVMNAQRERREVNVEIGALQPYETFKLRYKDHFDGLPAFLGGETGYAKVLFRLANSFKRLLCINQAADCSDFQVTHSDFDYSLHETSTLENGECGYMAVPQVKGEYAQEVVIYPDAVPGEYVASDLEKRQFAFSDRTAAIVPVEKTDRLDRLEFKKINGEVPTRLHTGMRIGMQGSGCITGESCLGITGITLPKRFHWMVVSGRPDLKCTLLVQDKKGVFENQQTGEATFNLYSQHSQEHLSATRPIWDLRNGLTITELFGEEHLAFLAGDYGWVTLFTPEVKTLVMFCIIENQSRSVTFEHAI
ncbi:MAG: hypothetical protein ACI97B_000937 [Verrucomicrobiales bacterium]|jgi:hypothetical protein